jgi:hypothetical protein
MNGSDRWPQAIWPIEEDGGHWGKEMLQSSQIAPWVDVEDRP